MKRLDICAWCSVPTWCEPRYNGKPQCFGCKAVAYFRWMYSYSGYKVLPWIEKALRDLYGSLDVETGRRRYTSAFLSMAKKNGKSLFLGGLPIYHMDQEDLGGDVASVVGVATNKKQASEVFSSCCALIRSNPVLSAKFTITPSVRKISHKSRGGVYDVLPGDGDNIDGCRVTLGLRDEIHRWMSRKQLDAYDAVQRGTRGKDQPLLVDITTAGDPTDSQLWLREYTFAKQVFSGAVDAPSHYPMIFEADPERLANEPEFWRSEEAQLQANPSHEKFGGHVRAAELNEDLAKAIASPDAQSSYWRFTLNAQADKEGKLFGMGAWEGCSAETKPLIGRRCYMGLDLSSTSDLTALVLAFPEEVGDQVFWDVLPFFWCPEENVNNIARRLGPWGPKFRQWVRDGLIETTPGNEVDNKFVKAKIKWAAEMFDLVEIDFDPYQARDLVHDLQDEGYLCVKVQQGYPELGPATQYLKQTVAKGQLRHGGHPVLAWHAACVKGKTDANGNVKPVKVKERDKETQRIDGIAALVTTLSRGMLLEGKSVYETRGMIIL